MGIASALIAIYAVVVLSVLVLVFRHFRALESAKQLKAQTQKEPQPTPAGAPARSPEPALQNAEEEEVTEFTLAVAGRPLLRITSGGKGQKDFFLSPIGVTTIGRGADNDIVIPGDAASSRHCRIEKQRGVYILIDDGSTNRTWVNGAEQKRVVLRNGDQIKVGETTMVFALFGDRT